MIRWSARRVPHLAAAFLVVLLAVIYAEALPTQEQNACQSNTAKILDSVRSLQHDQLRISMEQMQHTLGRISKALLQGEETSAQDEIEECSLIRSRLDEELQLREVAIEEATSKLQQRLDRLEQEKEKLVGEKQEAVTRLVLLHLRHADVNAAEGELKNLTSRDEVVQEIVRTAFAENSNSSDDLAAFAAKTAFFETSYLAMHELFAQLRQKQRLSANAVLSIYLELERSTQLKNFALQKESLREKIVALRREVEPHAVAILDALIGDVTRGAFVRALEAVDATKKARLQDQYVSHLVFRSLSTQGKNIFPQLHTFTVKLHLVSDTCHALFATLEKLSGMGLGDGFEALQTWLYATYVKEYSEFKNYSSSYWTKCKTIANAGAPAHKAQLTSEYLDMMRKKKTEALAALHRDYSQGMHVLMRNVIDESFSQNSDEAFGVVDNLTSLEGRCWAAEAVNRKVAIGSFEHFRALKLVKKIMAFSNFGKLGEFNAAQCRNATADTPAAFHTLLYGNRSNCRLMSRQNDEPLFCGLQTVAPFGREIFTWVPKTQLGNQLWNIVVYSDGEIALRSHLYADQALHRYADTDAPYASTGTLSYFRPHANPDGHLMLRNGNHYLGVDAAALSKHRRTTFYVNNEKDFQDQKLHWKLQC